MSKTGNRNNRRSREEWERLMGEYEAGEVSNVMNRLISSVFLDVALAGCGADVVGTAATEATLNAEEAKQAQQLKDQVRSQLNAAMRTEQDRLQQAEKAANP